MVVVCCFVVGVVVGHCSFSVPGGSCHHFRLIRGCTRSGTKLSPRVVFRMLSGQFLLGAADSTPLAGGLG